MWNKNHKRKFGGKKSKYRCEKCGFTGKGSVLICPNCKSNNITDYNSLFRFSSKKRKNACRKLRNKKQNQLINGQLKHKSKFSNNYHGLNKCTRDGNWEPVFGDKNE